jgi:type IV secretory pathway VirB3-like protein
MFLCLLKKIENATIPESKRESMKQQVLKALANPPRIFYVPYSLAVMNFAAQFIVFIAVFLIDLSINGINAKANPLYFLLSVITVHAVLTGFSKTEPQLAQIISSKIQLFKSKIPRRLTT